jgi:hypothetical protein
VPAGRILNQSLGTLGKGMGDFVCAQRELCEARQRGLARAKSAFVPMGTKSRNRLRAGGFGIYDRGRNRSIWCGFRVHLRLNLRCI